MNIKKEGPVLSFDPRSEISLNEFLKAKPSEVVLKNYKCYLTCDKIVIKGKVLFSTNFLFFISNSNKRLVLLVSFSNISSVTNLRTSIYITTQDEKICFVLSSLNRNDYVATFLDNYWSLIMKNKKATYEMARKYHACMLERRGETSPDQFSSPSYNSIEDTSLPTSVNAPTPEINLKLSSSLSYESDHLNLSTTDENPSLTHSRSSPIHRHSAIKYEPQIRKLAKNDPFSYSQALIISIKNLLGYLSDCTSMFTTSTQLNQLTSENASETELTISRRVSFTMVIAYVVIMFLAVSTFYVYSRMCRFSNQLLLWSRNGQFSKVCKNTDGTHKNSCFPAQDSSFMGDIKQIHDAVEIMVQKLQELKQNLASVS